MKTILSEEEVQMIAKKLHELPIFVLPKVNEIIGIINNAQTKNTYLQKDEDIDKKDE